MSVAVAHRWHVLRLFGERIALRLPVAALAWLTGRDFVPFRGQMNGVGSKSSAEP
jgi:hypothetical protein